MKAPIAAISLLFVSFAALGEEVIQEISWADLQKRGLLISGQVETVEGEEFTDALKVSNEGSEPTSLLVLEIEYPEITAPQYALLGKIRYENVEGEGYLEMWNYLPDGGKFFSKTLAENGPMEKIHGNSGWRPVVVPFSVTKGNARPSKLELSVVLPGKGVVHLSPLQLVQFQKGENPLAVPGEWWSQSGGGTMGAILGCLGGLFGVLMGTCGSLASKGRGRSYTFTILALTTASGVTLVACGLIAIGFSQPHHVYYPLLLAGLILSCLGAALIPAFRARYAQFELRKMDAMDGGLR